MCGRELEHPVDGLIQTAKQKIPKAPSVTQMTRMTRVTCRRFPGIEHLVYYLEKGFLCAEPRPAIQRPASS